MSDSLQPHGLYSQWNSPGQITEWVTIPFSKGSSQPMNWTQVSHIAGGFFTSWATREVQEYWSREPIPSPVDLADPGIELGSPELQVDFLPTALSEKPSVCRLWSGNSILWIYLIEILKFQKKIFGGKKLETN